jgi:dTDP-4-dehydrorhamnose reductase
VKLLITGATGQIGWQLQRTVAALGEVIALSRADLDLSKPEEAAAMVRDIKPDILLNAAAYTTVDKAESEPELARTINAVAPARMAQELATSGGLMVHYSTDYVFDGAKPEPYVEEDVTGPLNTYGRTKLEGEQGIVASGCAYLILRTSWVYDSRGKNFLRTVLRLAREREELRMVDDQHGAPTWARAIAEATANILGKYAGQANVASWHPTGVYHLTSSGSTTWAGFAQTILDEYSDLLEWPAEFGEFTGPLRAKRVVPISSHTYKTAALRPLNSQLSNAKLKRDFGLQLPDWRYLLRLAMLDTIS